MSIADFSLLNQDRLILLCITSSALMTYVLLHQTKRWYIRRFPYHLLASTLVGVVVWTILWHMYPEDGIPLKLIAWIAVSLFSISILFTIHRGKQRLIVAGIGAFCTVLFSMLLANFYFQYYPTLSSLFGSTTTQATATGSFIETTNHPLASQTSVEANYISPADQPNQGQLTTTIIPGPISHFTARPSFIYLPPAALSSQKPTALPVMILLSGVPGDPGDWKDRLNLQSAMDVFAAKHKGIAPIIVVADQTGGDGMTSTGCVDSTRGNAETYLTIDVPAYIKSHYDVTAAPQGWAIGGVSDGGACSTVIAARHPGIFGTFMSLSGETSPSIESKQDAINSLFGGSQQAFNAYDAGLLFASKNASSTYAHTTGWLALGRDEQQPLVQANRTLFDEAKKANVDMTLETLPGHHGFGLWKRAFTDALPWVSQHIGATQ